MANVKIKGPSGEYNNYSNVDTVRVMGQDNTYKEYHSVSGNLDITDTLQKDVSAYATAQVVDNDLVASNIKRNVNILGVTGSYGPQGTITIDSNGTYDVTDYEQAVIQVQSAGGGASEGRGVIFINSDGAIVEMWSSEEALEKTALPTGTTRAGLTFQGWNWTLQEIKDRLNIYMDDFIIVGSLYTTNDGYNHLYISLPDSWAGIPVQIAASSISYVDWDDGTVETSGLNYHTYSQGGNYCIKVGATNFGSNYYLIRAKDDGSYRGRNILPYKLERNNTSNFTGFVGCNGFELVTSNKITTNVSVIHDAQTAYYKVLILYGTVSNGTQFFNSSWISAPPYYWNMVSVANTRILNTKYLTVYSDYVDSNVLSCPTLYGVNMKKFILIASGKPDLTCFQTNNYSDNPLGNSFDEFVFIKRSTETTTSLAVGYGSNTMKDWKIKTFRVIGENFNLPDTWNTRATVSNYILPNGVLPPLTHRKNAVYTLKQNNYTAFYNNGDGAEDCRRISEVVVSNDIGSITFVDQTASSMFLNYFTTNDLLLEYIGHAEGDGTTDIYAFAYNTTTYDTTLYKWENNAWTYISTPRSAIQDVPVQQFNYNTDTNEYGFFGANGYYYSSDLITWTASSINVSAISLTATCRKCGSCYYIINGSSRIYESIDGGHTWTDIISKVRYGNIRAGIATIYYNRVDDRPEYVFNSTHYYGPWTSSTGGSYASNLTNYQIRNLTNNKFLGTDWTYLYVTNNKEMRSSTSISFSTILGANLGSSEEHYFADDDNYVCFTKRNYMTQDKLIGYCNINNVANSSSWSKLSTSCYVTKGTIVSSMNTTYLRPSNLFTYNGTRYLCFFFASTIDSAVYSAACLAKGVTGVLTIGDYAFESGTNIAKVTMSDDLTTVGINAFIHSYIRDAYFYTTTPPTFGSPTSFRNWTPTESDPKGRIHVPRGCAAAYIAQTNSPPTTCWDYIDPYDLSLGSIALTQSGFAKTGSAITPSISYVKNVNGLTLTENTDYERTGDTSKTAGGRYALTASGIGEYVNSISASWYIYCTDVTDATITDKQAVITSGVATIHPTIKLIGSDGNDVTLTEGTDYTLSGTTTATEEGTYTATATGIGSYSGSQEFTWTAVIDTLTYVVEPISGSTFTFNFDNVTGFYEPTNKGYNSTYAISRITFTRSGGDITVPLKWLQSSEQNYDYGRVSKLDTELSRTIDDDTSKLLLDAKGLTQTSTPQTLNITIPDGTHFIEVKYRKDGSQHSGWDMFKWYIATSGITTGNLYNRSTATINSQYLGSDGIMHASSADYAVIIPVSPNKTYTVTANTFATGDNRIGYFNTMPTAESTVGVVAQTITSNAQYAMTVTTGADTQYIAFHRGYSETYVANSFLDTIVVKELPSAYTKLNYIGGAGSQYIDTGVAGDRNRIYCNAKMNVHRTTSNWLYGTYHDTGSTGTTYALYFYLPTEGTRVYAAGGGSSVIGSTVVGTDETHVYGLDGLGKLYLDGTQDATWSPTSAVCDSIWIFGANGAGLTNTRTILYYAQFSQNGVLVRNMIPAIRTTDSVPGLYDSVTNTFFTNQGSGEFITG